MPRAEVGSTKYIANKMKSKGLQRLRWYCQICEKQCRDENGFKCHTQSESHVRRMLVVGEDAKRFITDYSNQFKSDFLTLLRSSHGEKKINANHFYQEYIGNKEHIHMNSTRWTSLSEFVKWLGREGVCRVEDGEKGLFVAWIDNSPEALQRQEAIRKKDRQDRGDEEREQRAIREQVERANREAEISGRKMEGDDDEEAKILLRDEGSEKIKLAFGTKPSAEESNTLVEKKEPEKPEESTKISMKIAPQKKKNVFATGSKKKDKKEKKEDKNDSASASEKLKRPMTEAERIMKQEIEQNRTRGGVGFKRQRVM